MLQRSSYFIVWFAALSLGALACDLLIGLKDGAPFDDSDASTDSALPDAGKGDERAVLMPDASTAMCDGGAGMRTLQADGDSVFVLAGGSTIVSSCGSKVNPCGTLAIGLKVADANRAKAVYLGPGTYAESLVMPSGVSIEGGFDVSGSTWTAQCDNVKTVLASTDAVAVRATGVLNAALRFLTIETKPHGAPAESVYGVLATDSVLTLDNVNVYAELAGPGAQGTAGTGTDTTDSKCSDTGGAGAAGAAGAPGTFSPQGDYMVGSPAGVGPNGIRGMSGAHTGPGCSSACVGSCTPSAVDDAGFPVDDSGAEIPDSSLGPACFQGNLPSTCASDVSVACGGFGGIGGSGGTNGAASIAVVAVGQTQITITGGSLASAGGGLGGDGAPGAPGATGGPGASGTAVDCFSTCGGGSCVPSANMPLTGGSTTMGGTGGAGGSGGGGSGGPTYLIVTVNGATAVGTGKQLWQIPTVGASGGMPNGPAGPFGEKSP